MDAWAIVGYVVGAIGVLASILLGIAAYSQKKKDTDVASGENKGVILTELGYIRANTEEIKTEQKEQRKINTDVYLRLGAVEASAKQAHKRLDEYMGHAKEN